MMIMMMMMMRRIQHYLLSSLLRWLCCLSFVSEFKFDGFSADTCRSLVAMKDVSFKRDTS